VSKGVRAVQTVLNGTRRAHGFCEYGPKYRDSILDRVRLTLEACESPQSFFLLHSMGGGTGSGLGTYLLSELHEEFPELYRFVSRESRARAATVPVAENALCSCVSKSR
jgi:hypothetical protein